jgi:glycosyltransferase 2 family protein
MHNTKKLLLAGLVTIVLIGILLSQIEISTVWSTLVSVNPIFLVIGFVIYVLVFVLRAIRMSIILEGKVSVRNLMSILFVHNLFNNLIPARLGELSFVYFLKEKENIPINHGLSSLMVARIFDLLGIAFLFIISFFLVGDLSQFVTICLMLVGVLISIIFAGLIMLLFYNKKFLRFVEIFASKTRLDRLKYTQMALEKGEETIENFKIIKSGYVTIVSFVISIMIWVLASMMTHIFLMEMEIYLSIWKILIASGIMVITTILPIHSVGGFGTIESIWTTTYVALGVSTQMAISSGFGIHLILVVYFLILGSVGLMMMKFDTTTDFNPLKPTLEIKEAS